MKRKFENNKDIRDDAKDDNNGLLDG